MKIKGIKIIPYLVLFPALMLVCFLIIILTGKTYQYTPQTYSSIDIEDVVTGMAESSRYKLVLHESDDTHMSEIIRITDAVYENGRAVITLQSNREALQGAAYKKIYLDIYDLESGEYVSYLQRFYVHRLGTITEDNFFGRSRGSVSTSFVPV